MSVWVNLSLSGRVAEGFFSKKTTSLRMEELADLALHAGYSAICMRPSQVGVHSTSDRVLEAYEILVARRLSVSMVSGDFAVVYNNDQGADCLLSIAPYLDLATALGSPMVRVAIRYPHQIAWAREAAIRAADRGILLVHQCHNKSLFETVDSIVETLERIDHPNFGLVYEPANLEMCGEDYGPQTIRRLAPWIRNVYLQNQLLVDSGCNEILTWARGPIRFEVIPIYDESGIDFPSILSALEAIDYRGPITVHQSAPANDSPHQMVHQTADYLRALVTASRDAL
ncbi:MAG: sugar phosphate isomerase/epimerase [Planctomycetota bacterium]|nr:sugar phosphate isomerase/epimerase [Planctomycetota bacterium]MDA1178850.1 sugar phosphate isomerase/epimerase [Planctomycetota bacterium]